MLNGDAGLVVLHVAAADVAAGGRDADRAEAAAIAEQGVERVAAAGGFGVARAGGQTVAARPGPPLPFAPPAAVKAPRR